MSKITWKSEPEEHDYPAAAAYLSLLADLAQVEAVVDDLKAAAVEHWKAKDLLRASRLPLLPADNPHVAADLHKVSHGQPLSPVLLVRGDLGAGIPLQVADGYHRVCATYLTAEDEDIPCKLAVLRSPGPRRPSAPRPA